VNKLSLFQANWDKQKEKWVNVHPLNLNNDEYTVEHPALSPDGNDLYFASDMPGGLGGLDLYVSHRILDVNGAQSWGKPESLGSRINTPGQEVFPFMDKEGNLWYASNGVPGLGGLDIFFAARTPAGFARPVNPGYPLNTRFDDFGFITDSEGEQGYFSSNRNNSGKDDDIYSISRPFRKILVQVVDARTHKEIPAAQVDVKTEGKIAAAVENTDLKPVWITINPYKSYDFLGKKEKYKTNELALSGQLVSDADTLKIPLVQEGPSIKLIGRVYKAMDHTPVQNTSVSMVNQSVSSQSEFKSDGNGLFSGELVSGTTFQILTSNTSGSICGALPILVSTNGIVRDTTIQVSIPLYCEGDIIRLGDIYYDLNKYNIRPDAAIVLDKLLKLMNDFPKMKIELRSHTDSRASAEYNMKLSDNRAKSAAEYLFSKGIARERIVGKGYGESLLINKCADGVSCTEEEHQLNRRTEFKILSLQ
jgi:outer membrane protein OmpA-like peptidoglycan-associated protein